ncbi:putative hydro-lyase [Zwartia panacis]|uniref:putative hydro-lyase n=1 Tax=Zwartia panacis TaxID=2683345 RepID=UPI0025B552AF|nr:putative hydro-lyase [Zwartia panacis]MDN4017939.1 putative hydro-lyase [Zwartia panacis]
MLASQQVRQNIRQGIFTQPTAGAAPGFVQANLVVLPKSLAADFMLFCQRNPKPCPLLSISDPGSTFFPGYGDDLDIRTDIPRYRVWRNGELIDEVSNVTTYWRDDLISFAIGCSFSFEEALVAEGLDVRHISCASNVPMYRSNISTQSAGPFHGPLVVSMRPFKPADAIRAIQLTSKFPSVHGAPVHIGDASQIGISDLSKPDFGEPVEVRAGELPVFWACGVTPQAVLMASKPEFCITHAPGYMLVTDKLNAHLAII